MPQFLPYTPPSSSAPVDGYSLDGLFQCWWDGQYGLHCNDLFHGNDLSAHLRDAHGIRGADKSFVCCQWDQCNSVMKKESLVRHVEERHLGIAYRCDTCGKKSYSRKDTLNRHKKTCSGL
ncbi:hypothetical protein K503DRAFT_788231 [Rhizopogon vinicolor AM-OR11-026]|uniref:C2H2-type domain-containing protein n=1 Tax=Rhizopogon vinicolor AM-OR11-026 TaxID=1314800 RepID=A0A1B7MDX3_9AGAM|nr:hypothetical protein K503DRAFT_788231 [Rhizopogon vinicolor AM-OR11-026]